ncbi:MAG: phosphatase PAP2 family protein [Marinobacterium sp.]|nr:phosphatase PAP2 family protein [Marinobacterium sp.]
MTDFLNGLQQPELLTWLLPLITLIALLESLFLVGLLLPGVAMLAVTAWLAGQQSLPVTTLLTAGIAGALLGDALSFYLGRYWSAFLWQMHCCQRNPHWQQRGEAFFQRYGAFSLLLGRFVGPIRPFIPFIAGSLKMPERTFWSVNFLSALLWAPVYLLPAYWLGQQSTQLETSNDLPLQLLAALALTLLAGYGLHHQLQPQRPLQRNLHTLPPPEGATLMGVLALSGLLLLALLRAFVPPSTAEQQLHNLLESLPEALYPATVAITSLGDMTLAGLACTLVLLALTLKGRRRTALVFASLLLSVLVINHLLKEYFSWPRPDTGAQLYQSWSFPSAHASTGTALFAMLAILLAERLNEQLRQLFYGLLALPALLIPLSRVLLDLHWPLDVLAGFCEGLVAAALWRHWLARHPVIFSGRERLLLLAGLSLITTGYLYGRLPAALLFYQSTTG